MNKVIIIGSEGFIGKHLITFFKEKNIPGKIYNDKWINFAHNRTLALEYAFNTTDLLLVFDADDEIHGTLSLPLNKMIYNMMNIT